MLITLDPSGINGDLVRSWLQGRHPAAFVGVVRRVYCPLVTSLHASPLMWDWSGCARSNT